MITRTSKRQREKPVPDPRIRQLLRSIREGKRCVSCIATALGVSRLEVMTDLASIAGVFAITFSSTVCTGCDQPAAVPRPR